MRLMRRVLRALMLTLVVGDNATNWYPHSAQDDDRACEYGWQHLCEAMQSSQFVVTTGVECCCTYERTREGPTSKVRRTMP